MDAVILAGGMGERLQSVVSDVPKPIAPVGGRPFLEYVMDYWLREKISRFILCVGFKHNLIEKHFRSEYKGVPIEYSIEDRSMGTGGGLLLCFRKFKFSEHVVVLNGDTYFEVHLADFKAFHSAKHSDWSIALSHVGANQRYGGILMNQNGEIESFKSDVNSKPSENTFINGGVYLVNPKIFDSYSWDGKSKVSLESDVIPSMLQKKTHFFGFVSRAKFIDIGIPEDYCKAREMFDSN